MIVGTCETCVFADWVNSVCRRYPPHVFTTISPITKDDWCGEYKKA